MTVKYDKPSPRGHWQVQEAKARFSELFRTARAEGPQRVSLQGKIFAVTDRIADRWGLIAARTQSRGKPVHVIDGLLAATALEHNLILTTRNTVDMDPTGVPLQNPWE